MDNPNPEVYETKLIERKDNNENDENIRDEFDSLEVNALVRFYFLYF